MLLWHLFFLSNSQRQECRVLSKEKSQSGDSSWPTCQPWRPLVTQNMRHDLHLYLRKTVGSDLLRHRDIFCGLLYFMNLRYVFFDLYKHGCEFLIWLRASERKSAELSLVILYKDLFHKPKFQHKTWRSESNIYGTSKLIVNSSFWRVSHYWYIITGSLSRGSMFYLMCGFPQVTSACQVMKIFTFYGLETLPC